jgi:hypothetical protein
VVEKHRQPSAENGARAGSLAGPRDGLARPTPGEQVGAGRLGRELEQPRPRLELVESFDGCLRGRPRDVEALDCCLHIGPRSVLECPSELAAGPVEIEVTWTAPRECLDHPTRPEVSLPRYDLAELDQHLLDDVHRGAPNSVRCVAFPGTSFVLG